MIFHFRNGSIIVEDKYNTDIAGIVFFHEERYRRINTRQRWHSTVNTYLSCRSYASRLSTAFCDTRSAIFATVSSKQVVAGIIRERFWENGCGANISEPRVTRNAFVRKNAEFAENKFSPEFDRLFIPTFFSLLARFIKDILIFFLSLKTKNLFDLYKFQLSRINIFVTEKISYDCMKIMNIIYEDNRIIWIGTCLSS